jgi:recombination protein RecT
MSTQGQGQSLARRDEKPLDALKRIVSAGSVQAQIQNALGEAAPLFVASLIDVVGSNRDLMKCDQAAIVREALKAATLRLPLNRGLGFAWIVPYGGTPQFQIGYRGFVQLAQRTGLYRFINADMVYAGETVVIARMSGDVQITGTPTSDEVIGYFAYFELMNGFRKTLAWTKTKLVHHAEKYSKSFGNRNSPWNTGEFDKMALKTVLAELLRKWAPLSVEMQQAVAADLEDSDPRGVDRDDRSADVDLTGIIDCATEDTADAPAQAPADAATDETGATVPDPPEAEPAKGNGRGRKQQSTPTDGQPSLV